MRADVWAKNEKKNRKKKGERGAKPPEALLSLCKKNREVVPQGGGEKNRTEKKKWGWRKTVCKTPTSRGMKGGDLQKEEKPGDRGVFDDANDEGANQHAKTERV